MSWNAVGVGLLLVLLLLTLAVSEVQKAWTAAALRYFEAAGLTTIHFLEQKDGVPYELEQVRCADCEEVVDEAKHRLVA